MKDYQLLVIVKSDSPSGAHVSVRTEILKFNSRLEANDAYVELKNTEAPMYTEILVVRLYSL